MVDEARDNTATDIDATPRTEGECDVTHDGAEEGTEGIDGRPACRRRSVERRLGNLARRAAPRIVTLELGDRLPEVGQARSGQYALGRCPAESPAQDGDQAVLVFAGAGERG